MGRGIDFVGVNLVINYDFPQSAIAYIHTIGNTGVFGKTLNFCIVVSSTYAICCGRHFNITMQIICNKTPCYNDDTCMPAYWFFSWRRSHRSGGATRQGHHFLHQDWHHFHTNVRKSCCFVRPRDCHPLLILFRSACRCTCGLLVCCVTACSLDWNNERL